jgi:hypothetical protein
VDPHPHRKLELRLRLVRGSEGIGCSPEGNEERVALRVHLDPMVSRDGLADDPAMVLEQSGVALAVLLQQPGRPFDVRE